MPDFHVTWEIEVVAEDPVAAAREAEKSQRKAGAWASVFDVTDDHGETTRVDLAEQGSAQGPFELEIRDWRFGEEAYDAGTPPALKGAWQAKVGWSGDGAGLDIHIAAPDGTTRSVWIEIEDGNLRVRVYPDTEVSDEFAGELRLKPGAETAEANFEP
jgi:hypothetical protein